MTATTQRRRVPQVGIQCLTITPPWPDAIRFGKKRIENRTWKPWRLKDDWLALHAGVVKTGANDLINLAIDWSYILDRDPHLRQQIGDAPTVEWRGGTPYVDRRDAVRFGLALKDHLTEGGIFAVCRVASTLYIPEDAPLPPLTDRYYAHGQIGWKLVDVMTFPPIPAKGSRLLWQPTDEQTAAIKQAVRLHHSKELNVK